MPPDSNVPDRHRRIRHDHAAETAEDYVEAVQDICENEGRCRVVDLAKRFDVSHVTVIKIVLRLQREGLLESEPYGPITLTPHGLELATHSQRRHQIVYKFLVAIGVDRHIATIDAEGIEHHVSPQTLSQFEKFAAKRTSHRSTCRKNG